MINAYFIRKGKHFSVEIKGHSGSAPRGEDIVCAAVSAGFLYLVAMLEDCGGKIISKREEEGFGAVSFSGGEREEGAYLMLFSGLSRLAKAYPEFVRVEERRVKREERRVKREE